MKSFAASLVVFAVLGQILCDYNLHEGDCNGNKKILHEERIVNKGNLFNTQKKTVEYCGEGIKCVDVWNLLDDGTGGNATINYGGPENQCVIIKMESQEHKGMAFKVQIWGKE